MPLAPRYVLYCNENLMYTNLNLYDKYGDSYFDNVDKYTLTSIFKEMNYDKKIFLEN